MNKKFYFMAALAACATFYSCSSDEDVTAEVQSPLKNTNVPFGVSVAVEGDATRGVDLTADGFNKFFLYGVRTDGDEAGTVWFNGAQFTPSTDEWSAGVKKWSDGQTATWREGTYNFYAATPTALAAPSISNTAATFDYEVPADGITAQEDLMVAKATGLSSADGKIDLDFYHALASISFSVNLDALSYVDEEDPDQELNDPEGKLYTAWISKIILHNLKSQGTFNFATGTTGAWSGQTEYVDYEYNVAGNVEIPFVPKTATGAWTPLTFTEGSVFVMPQDVMAWVPNTGSTLNSLPTGENKSSYIEVVCQVRAQMDKTDPNDVVYYIFEDNGGSFNALSEKNDAGFGSVYIPLKLSSGKFEFNKHYHLKLQLSTARNASGDIAIVGGNAVIG